MEAASDSSNNGYLTTDNVLKLFQAILGLSTLFYVAGYITWGLFADQNGLGFLPALQEQYIVAGIIPGLILLILLILSILTYKAPTYVHKQPKRWLIAFGILFASICLHIYIYIIINSEWHHVTFTLLIFTVIFFIVFSIKVKLKCIESKFNLDKSKELHLQLFCIASTFVIGTIAWSNLYINDYFPSIPRAYGGPEAACCVLDVDSKQLSQQTVYDLCGKLDSLSENGLYRTQPVHLIFDSDDFLLLKLQDTAIGRTNPLIKIKTSSVNALIPCSLP